MGKFTNFVLIFALLVAGVGGVNARTNVDMSTVSTSANATWNSETNTFSWTAQDAYIVIPGLSGDLTGCYLNFTKGQAVNSRIDIVYTDNSVTVGTWNGLGMFGASTGAKTQNLGAMAGAKITSVKEVRFCSATTSGSLTLTDISYFYPVVPQFNADGVATINLKSLVASGGLSFDASTGVVTCDGNIGTLSLEFLNGVNLTGLKRYDVSISGTDNIMWRSIVKSRGTDVLAYYGSKWGGNLTDEQRAKALSVNEFFWESKSSDEISKVEEGNRTFTINSITLTADKMNVEDAHNVSIATLPHYNVADDGTVSLASAIVTRYNVSTDIPLGDGGGEMNEYIDIEDYDELRIYTSDNMRVFMINEEITSGTNAKAGKTLYLGDSPFSHNSSDNYYYASVSAIKSACNGQAKIIGVKKTLDGSNVTVSKIQVAKDNPAYNYILSGQYSSSIDISSVTSDAEATAVDCRGLSGNDATISSANPNCLFVANAGVLANNKNVIVGSTCANLELVDGEPFKAPADFTATNAKFTKPVGEAGYATMVIPFAVATLPEGVEAYNLTGVTGESIAYSTAATIAADKPVLIKATEGTYNFEASGVAVAATADGVVTNGLLKGGYATMTAAADANNYVLQNNANGVNFYLVKGTPATVKPFRAYLMAPTNARALSFDFNTTGVNGVKVNSEKAEVYNLNGQRVAAPQKGLYIVGGKKVIVK